MHEDTKKKTIDKTPVKIRPPDDAESKAEGSRPAGAWAMDISVPTREKALPRWLSVEQVRKMQRMRRETVKRAIRNGELPFERRGRIIYIRLSDVLTWEEKRIGQRAEKRKTLIHPDLKRLL
jgi:excisionase family DNA binding protein